MRETEEPYTLQQITSSENSYSLFCIGDLPVIVTFKEKDSPKDVFVPCAHTPFHWVKGDAKLAWEAINDGEPINSEDNFLQRIQIYLKGERQVSALDDPADGPS